MISTRRGRHARPDTSDRRRRVVAGATAVLIGASLLTAAPAFAAKGGGGTTSSGGCSISPNPVAVGSAYTLTGWGLGSSTLVNVLISDPVSVTSLNLQADAGGNLSLTTSSYWAGTTKITIQKNARHGFTTIATCSVSVT